MNMFNKAAAAALLFGSMLLASPARAEDDFSMARRVGESAKIAGFITTYSVKPRTLTLNMGSVSPADAEFIGSGVCKFASTLGFSRPWEIHVFLIIGERPAYVCPIKPA